MCAQIWCECRGSILRLQLLNPYTLGPPVHQVKFGAPRRKETDPLNEPVSRQALRGRWCPELGQGGRMEAEQLKSREI